MAPPKVKNPPVQPRLRFSINCGLPAQQHIVHVKDFVKFLKERLKVNGEAGNLGGGMVSITRHKRHSVVIISRVHLSKRYLKYLTKIYLHERHLKDVMRPVANTDGFELRYKDDKEDDEEDDEEDDD